MVPGTHSSRRAVLGGIGTLLIGGCLDRTRRSTEADDWRMYGRDPGRTRYVPDVEVPDAEPEIAWDRSVGASGWRPPIVADATVYCQYANGLFVIDPTTGEGTLLNTYGAFGRGTGPMAFAPTEIYRDGALVVPYGGAIAGYAADPEGWPDEVSGFGGELLRWWSDGEHVGTGGAGIALRSGESRSIASPLVTDGTLVTVHHFSDSVSAVRPDDGNPRWRYALEDAIPDDWDYDLHPIGHVVDETTGTVVVKGRLFGTPYLIGLDLADGDLEWTVDERETDAEFNEREDSLLAREGVVYTVGQTEDRDRRILEVDAETGERGWDRTLDRSDHVGLAADERRLYHVGTVARDGIDPLAVTALDLDDGSVRWEVIFDGDSFATTSFSFQPPTVAGDSLLVPGDDGLHALDCETGDLLWTFTEMVGTSGGSEKEREALTPPVVTNDRIVLGTTLALYGLDIS
ncbi:PQQ-binding-like beta-propeller repeat protein [Natronolimnohabitans sp. A-GB9]|uniref:outer membrane protein assembly factor BamB family protein n=1 Tax=Natronolimnohabitans sp. A-GB9 TaxID=3069757 RepID=UPI0027B104BA|nr:PQQ-binding-like beta-propeller repeat protein [Natronolimnohabitans sp. A-GB9]MDQ2051997.1 PQQ-binding-like beta-propeller repeat protein [Natronolimnohabitans sp. A-GB9]